MKRITSVFIFLFAQATALLGQVSIEDKFPCNSAGCSIYEFNHFDGMTYQWSGACKDGLAEGNGNLEAYFGDSIFYTFVGEYSKGLRKGKGVINYNDKITQTFNYVEGNAIGIGKAVSDDGTAWEGQVLNGVFHGNGKVSYGNGDKFEGFLRDNKPYSGIYTRYDDSLMYVEEAEFVDNPKLKPKDYIPQMGVRLTEYFDSDWNRCDKKDASYYRLVTYEQPNKPVGTVKDFYVNGRLQEEFEVLYLDYYDQGRYFRHGKSLSYYESGELFAKSNYKNNLLSGSRIEYFESGVVKDEGRFVRGVLSGPRRVFYESGNLKYFFNYENGKYKNGKYVYYNEEGVATLASEQKFSSDTDIWVYENENDVSFIGPFDELLVRSNSDKRVVRMNEIPLNPQFDFLIGAEVFNVSPKGKDAFGMIFGYKDPQNYFMFMINNKGKYRICGYIEGLYVVLRDWTASDQIMKGKEAKTNSLYVTKKQGDLIFSINDDDVDKMDFKPFKGDFHGFVCEGKGLFAIRSFQTMEFMPAAEIAKVVPPQYSTADGWLGNGSGFFISPQGHIATNYHVIENANDIQVEYFQKGVKLVHKAKVIVVDKQNDLAILQISDSSFRTLAKLPYSFSTNIKDVGSDVFALGYPLEDMMGSEIKFTDGKISSKTGAEGDITCYQISVPLQPGNSGGPLFDSNGELIGVNSAIFNKEIYNSENVSYAIKSTYLKNLVDVLPEQISLPDAKDIKSLPLTEKIKVLSDFIPIIRIR